MMCCGWAPWAPSIGKPLVSLGWGKGTGFLKNKPTKVGEELAQRWPGQSGLTVCYTSLPIFPYCMVSVEEGSAQRESYLDNRSSPGERPGD